jgi:hypothetical protein
MKNFKKLLEIQKNKAQSIIDNKFYSDDEKIEQIENLFIGDNDLTDLEDFKNNQDLDLMQNLRADAMNEFLNKI